MISLKPFSSQGELFLIEGEPSLLPLQLFSVEDGEVYMRIGSTVLCFDQEGNYLGTECKFPSRSPYPDEINSLFSIVKSNRNKLPLTSFFAKGTKQYVYECKISEIED